jgi:hypothetical protein
MNVKNPLRVAGNQHPLDGPLDAGVAVAQLGHPSRSTTRHRFGRSDRVFGLRREIAAKPEKPGRISPAARCRLLGVAHEFTRTEGSARCGLVTHAHRPRATQKPALRIAHLLGAPVLGHPMNPGEIRPSVTVACLHTTTPFSF